MIVIPKAMSINEHNNAIAIILKNLLNPQINVNITLDSHPPKGYRWQ